MAPSTAAASASASLAPIKVWGKGGPNPPRVAILLAELGLPHEIIALPLTQVKDPAYVAINPNGRLPTIQDPNNDDLIVWESGAIVEYLIARYDPGHRLSFAPGTPEAAHATQWLFFQASGQGPYYGQAAWFKKFHPERLPSALQRYVQEINRVTAVVEGQLQREKEKQPAAGGDGPWLVGGRCSFADLAWVSWQVIVAMVIKPEDGYTVEDYPLVKEWLGRLMARPGVKKGMEGLYPDA
ncbi:putative glutathione S-transferase [Aspergillus uvarum CBS 121591]|uniref:Putative glutathione S-transferase n=1 Tax=Aspergillus uvarum CBS 121591 TaxID=1448315 RepID=A0A319CNU5_9EURO|nr:putative glutathione S-transferase [Aspergillus uvarum CBS 121591]PYH85731.1 putative glutathione S-transferase [Aspergillus uvarum CBS 121591]